MLDNLSTMQAESTPDETIKNVESLRHGHASMEPKLDGFRCLAIIHPDGEVNILSRNLKDKSGRAPHVEEALSKIAKDMVGVTILDGEIGMVSHEMDGQVVAFDFRKTSMVMGAKPERAHHAQVELGQLATFVVFDCRELNGLDIQDRADQMRRDAAKLCVACADSHYVRMIPRYGVHQEILDEIINAGGEGVIVKDTRKPYLPGCRRADTWAKVKYNTEADVVITGFEPASVWHKKPDPDCPISVHESCHPHTEEPCLACGAKVTKYYARGWIGAIKFGQYTADAIEGEVLRERGQTSGFDDEIRKAISENPNDYIGRVMVIKHYGLTPDGAFRHPQFLRFRDDKDAEDCTWEATNAE